MARKIILAILILAFIFAGTGIYYIYKSLSTVSYTGNEQDIPFEVNKGESLYSVLDRLEGQNLIQNTWVYKIYNRFIDPLSVKSGSYSIKTNWNGLEILRFLEEGKQELIRVTIPEGLTSRQIAFIFEEKGILDSESFLQAVRNKEIVSSYGIAGDSLEGYLFPDTYYFQKDFPVEKVIDHMVKTYFTYLEEIFPFYKDLSPDKLQEKIILASIVEKEYRVSEEAPLIASVFINRLKIGMPLQSCATVIYVITEEQKKEHPDRVLFRDLEIPSPFNTYYVDSLPPAAIANPGRTALDAAFNPAQTDFLFFVVKDSAAGTHNFTSSLADHNEARQSYLEGFRSK